MVIKSYPEKYLWSHSSIDIIFTSQPYYNTLDYVTDNRLRNEFLGFDQNKREKLKKN